MKNSERNELAYRINRIRVLRNETLEEFAEQIKKKTNFKIKTTKSNVSKWEKGLNVPNDITLNAIAALGNTTIEELVAPPLENAIEHYLDEIMAFEIKQGDQKYKLLYDPGEKKELLEFLHRQDWEGLTIKHGARYETKELIEKYLYRKEILRKYTNPYSDKNTIWYVQDELLRPFKKSINEFFATEDVDLQRTSYLQNNQIKNELSFELYKEIIRNLDTFSKNLNQFEI